ncbi:uncharacterized protein LOC116182672 [Photinus pyralis]|nr:uncharacterized protein LOC116182672 [Photinus pyralis]
MTSEEGFVKAGSNNLPSVDIFMVMEFIKNDDRFNAAEIRGIKAAAAGREEYGDNAVGYVELKRANSLCTLQCKICPEHKVRAKHYTVSMTVDEAEEKIVNVECKDCAASAGGCKHALAFLMWVHRRSEEPSPTEITSYWKKPRLSAVGTSLKFVTAAEFRKTRNTTPGPSEAATIVPELTKAAESANLTGHLLKYTSDAYEDKFECLSVYKLMCKFAAEGGSECSDFLKFATTRMIPSVCTDAAKMTKLQAKSPLWHELRFGRITASKLYEFAHCKTADGTLIEGVIGAL